MPEIRKPGPDPARVALLPLGLDSVPDAYEEADHGERDQERRCVEPHHVRRPEERDQHAGECGTEQIGDVAGALDEAVRLGELLFALTDDGGQDQPLAGEVRAPEGAEQDRDHEDHGERQPADGVQERDERHDRRPCRVRDQHRGPRPETCTTEPAGMPSSAIGASSAAKTRPIFVGEPVVTRTNQGSAR